MSPQAPHRYVVTTRWDGNLGTGTSGYRDYARDWVVESEAVEPLQLSADRQFRGDPTRHNPEDLLVAAVSGCHMLWYLHECATAGVTVVGYSDEAEGVLEMTDDGGGAFTEIVLRPHVTLAPGADSDAAARLHDNAHRKCFIARSVNFPVRVEPQTSIEVAP